MESRVLKAIKFMTQSQYSSESKESNNLYLVEFRPDVSMFPDYSAGISISANTTYTVGSGVLANYDEGWFRIGLTSASWHGQSPQIVININGQGFHMNYGCGFTMVYLSKGNTFSTNSVSNCNARFFPVKTS